MAAKSPKLIVFDLDGTLIDSRRDIADSANEVIVSYGGVPLPEDRIGRMVGDGAPILIARALPAGGINPAPPDALGRFLAAYDRRLVTHTRLYPGVDELVRTLHRHMMLAVLTNKPTAQSRRILETLGIADLFFACLGGDGPFPRKPAPDGLCSLMRDAGAEPRETWLVGDSHVDLETARRAAVVACLVRYGFGFDSVDSRDLTDRDVIIDTARELLPRAGVTVQVAATPPA